MKLNYTYSFKMQSLREKKELKSSSSHDCKPENQISLIILKVINIDIKLPIYNVKLIDSIENLKYLRAA